MRAWFGGGSFVETLRVVGFGCTAAMIEDGHDIADGAIVVREGATLNEKVAEQAGSPREPQRQCI